MFAVRTLAAAAVIVAPGLAFAQADTARDLFDAMRMDDVLEIMRAEGIAYGEDLEADLFPGDGGETWDAAVARIYASDRMRDEMLGAFERDLAGVELAPLVDFFTSDSGAEIVSYEVEARRALMDEAMEEAAGEQVQSLPGPRLDQIETFIEINDLVEQNVAGAMNSNYAFYQGMAEGGALIDGLSEGQIIEDVWAQEPAIREDTIAWLTTYLGLAFAPVEAEDLDTYIALSDSDAGQALNATLFAAFDTLYIDISRELGVAAAGYLQGEDI